MSILMKATRAGLTVVTFLSWMVNARTSFFIARMPVRIRNGLTSRSVGSNSMLPLVLCSRQEWHAFCQRVRKVHQFLLWRMLLMAFWVLFGFFLVSCAYGVLALLGSLLCTRLGFLRCASCWTRPFGGGRWGHYFCNLWGEYLKVHKVVYEYLGIYVDFWMWEPYMLASAGQPSLHGYDACMVYWTNGALRRNCRLKLHKTSFSPFLVFLFSQNSRERYGGLVLWHL